MILIHLPFFWHASVVWYLRLMSISLIVISSLFCPMRVRYKIQTSVKDISGAKKFNKVILYHGLTKQRTQSLQINYKISPLKGFFTFDPKGYAGFGLSASQRQKWLRLNDTFVEKRSQKILNQSFQSKYRSARNVWRGDVPDVILVEQLASDKVSELRNFSDLELEELVSDYCHRHKLTWAWRRHPLSNSVKNSKHTEVPLDVAVDNDVVFVTHNSGLGCEILHKRGRVIFCAKNEFFDEAFVHGCGNDAFFDYYFTKEFQKLQFEDFKTYLGTLLKWSDIGPIKNLLCD